MLELCMWKEERQAQGVTGYKLMLACAVELLEELTFETFETFERIRATTLKRDMPYGKDQE